MIPNAEAGSSENPYYERIGTKMAERKFMPWTRKLDQDKTILEKENYYEPASLMNNQQSEVMALFEDNKSSALEVLKSRGPKSTRRFDEKDLDIYQKGTAQSEIDEDYGKA